MEKGSMLTAIEHGSVGPKRMAKAISESKTVLPRVKIFVIEWEFGISIFLQL